MQPDYRENRWQTLCVVLIAFFVSYFLGTATLPAQRDDKPAKIDENVYSGVRLGMAVPYFGQELPPGFVWADGKTNWPDGPDAAWLPKHLRGKPVPNLNGRVCRGASTGELVGATGGSDEVKAHATANDGAHTHRVPDHDHALPELTGPIADTGDAINNVRYMIKDDQGGWRKNEGGGAHHLEVGGGANDEGQHRHKLGGRTGKSGILTTMQGDGAHSHQIPAVAHVPSYVAVQYIIRVR